MFDFSTIKSATTQLLNTAKSGEKYVKNTAWLITDKIIRQGITFYIGIRIARYLGPEDYGLWNYVMATCIMFSAFSSLGLDSILIRELVKRPKRESAFMGSAFVLRLLGGGVAFLLSLIAIFVLNGPNPTYLAIGAITAGAFIFQSLDVIDYYYQSQVKSRYVIYARLFGFLATTGIKIFLIVAEYPLISFVWVTLFEIVLTCLALLGLYQKEHTISKWRWETPSAKYLLKHSWPLALSSIVITLYMRLDQVMLGKMANNDEVGVYSAAVRICEMWYFIPMIICSSLYPGIVKARQSDPTLYRKTFKWIYFSFFWFSSILAISTLLVSDIVIDMLYGQGFKGADAVLNIYIFSGIATFIGVASSQYLMAENFTLISLYRTLLGLTINVLLNIFLIPPLGAQGAAWATLISYTLATYSLFFFKKSRAQGLLMIKAIVLRTS